MSIEKPRQRSKRAVRYAIYSAYRIENCTVMWRCVIGNNCQKQPISCLVRDKTLILDWSEYILLIKRNFKLFQKF